MIARLSLYLPLEARHAADIYERQGKTGLTYHFDQVTESGAIEPYLLDENWKDMLGRNPPARPMEFAKTAREEQRCVSFAAPALTFGSNTQLSPGANAIPIKSIK